MGDAQVGQAKLNIAVQPIPAAHVGRTKLDVAVKPVPSESVGRTKLEVAVQPIPGIYVGRTKINVAISQPTSIRICDQFTTTYKRRTIPLPHILWRGMV